MGRRTKADPLASLIARSSASPNRASRPGDKWHMDKVFTRFQGEQHYLRRALDQDGIVLDILVQRRRDAGAAQRFSKRSLKSLR